MKKLKDKEKFSGLMLRLPVSLHEALKKEAAKEGVSLNQYCIYILSKNLKSNK